ncbi:hypothetical protein AN643_03970 [Candidatus Epulonipiscioides saccharophilum]|nr:hypothetical protein AN643_03970 [Epulopiscium sp. SCG-B10WGA-EpuloB]
MKKKHIRIVVAMMAIILNGNISQLHGSETLAKEYINTNIKELAKFDEIRIQEAEFDEMQIQEAEMIIKEYDPLEISLTWPTRGSRSYDHEKEKIVSALLNEDLVIDLRNLGLESKEANTYFRELLANDKRLFHVLEGWMYAKTDKGEILEYIYPNYDRHLADNYEYYKKILDEEIERAIEETQKGKSTVDKLLILNDYLATRYEYDREGLKEDNEIRDKVRFIEERRGVCESYADFAKLVLNDLGIGNITVSSIKLNHIWNMVEVDGNWYNIDFTWSDVTPDLTGRAAHEHFMISSERKIELNKELDDWTGSIPYRANSKKYEDIFTGTSSPYAYIGEEAYYINNINKGGEKATGEIRKLDTETGQVEKVSEGIESAKWYASEKSYYAGKYSGFGEHEEKLYYNTPEEILSYDVRNAEEEEIEVEIEKEKEQEYWGLNVGEGQLKVVLGEDIKLSSEFEDKIISIGEESIKGIDELIRASEENLRTVIISEYGDNINPYNQWVKQADIDKLEEKIGEAKELVARHPSASQVLFSEREGNEQVNELAEGESTTQVNNLAVSESNAQANKLAEGESIAQANKLAEEESNAQVNKLATNEFDIQIEKLAEKELNAQSNKLAEGESNENQFDINQSDINQSDINQSDENQSDINQSKELGEGKSNARFLTPSAALTPPSRMEAKTSEINTNESTTKESDIRELDAMQEVLLLAYNEFNNAKKDGTLLADTTSLEKMIKIVEDNLENTVKSPNDPNMDEAGYWISEAYYNYLNEKYQEGVWLMETSYKTQAEVNRLVFLLHNRNLLFEKTRRELPKSVVTATVANTISSDSGEVEK